MENFPTTDVQQGYGDYGEQPYTVEPDPSVDEAYLVEAGYEDDPYYPENDAEYEQEPQFDYRAAAEAELSRQEAQLQADLQQQQELEWRVQAQEFERENRDALGDPAVKRQMGQFLHALASQAGDPGLMFDGEAMNLALEAAINKVAADNEAEYERTAMEEMVAAAEANPTDPWNAAVERATREAAAG